ncbi:DUF3021 domain-containing protein [Sporosarcina sp. G11-34]|uniref:DUF3021 domain-containing protein n=1 Tax=Sporosarcina sp. G11-34 TaxID=2849605 RepID=UPI0022A96FEE|nr:DUF3021 domain-containing protein [Sporosarcina sp. G11-34]MCZ2259311.1 DUF3021 domain-containing protein [Sporosarcina sp. G11-34]
MKVFLFRSMIGIFFGAFIAVVLTNSLVYFGSQEVLDGELFMKNSLGSIFCGWFFTVGPLYFENTNLRLSQQTGLHFITVVVLYFILAFGIGWVPFTVKSFLLALGLFVMTYLIFWTSFYLYFRNQAKKLNAELQEL